MFPVLFSLGPLTVTSYGVLVLVAFFSGAFVVWKKGREEHFEEEELFDMTLLITFWVLVVARTWYVVGHFGDFGWNALKWMMLVRNPGLGVEGAILGGLVAVWFYAIKKKWSFWATVDVVVLGVGVVHVWMFLAAFLNGSGYGVRSSLPWAINFAGVEGSRHPVQLYGLGLWIVWFWLLYKIFTQYRTYDWYRGKAVEAASGLVAAVYFVGMGLMFLLMGWLQPASVFWGGMGVRVWWGILGILLGLVVGYVRSGRIFGEDTQKVLRWVRQKGLKKKQVAVSDAEEVEVSKVKSELSRHRVRKRHGIVAGVDVK